MANVNCTTSTLFSELESFVNSKVSLARQILVKLHNLVTTEENPSFDGALNRTCDFLQTLNVQYPNDTSLQERVYMFAAVGLYTEVRERIYALADEMTDEQLDKIESGELEALTRYMQCAKVNVEKITRPLRRSPRIKNLVNFESFE